jgi:hypothetical protein
MSIQFQDSLRLQPGNALTRGSASAAAELIYHSVVTWISPGSLA